MEDKRVVSQLERSRGLWPQSVQPWGSREIEPDQPGYFEGHEKAGDLVHSPSQPDPSR
jgi:hypothetical protein